MNPDPVVSIITVNLNNAEGLRQTCESLFTQSLTDYEFIVIDGGSTDGSVAFLEQHTNRITYWVSEPDRGIYHAMNKGIEQATSTYCLFLNSGDWLVDERVLDRCFENEQTADLLIGGCHVSTNGRIIHTSSHTDELTLQSFYGATIPHQATFIKRALFHRLGLYEETYTIHGDYEFWIRAIILNNCSLKVLSLIITDYNLEGISSQPQSQKKSTEEIHKILHTAFPERVLTDYEYWRNRTNEMQMFYWMRGKNLIYSINLFVYTLACQLVKLKKNIMSKIYE